MLVLLSPTASCTTGNVASEKLTPATRNRSCSRTSKVTVKPCPSLRVYVWLLPVRSCVTNGVHVVAALAIGEARRLRAVPLEASATSATRPKAVARGT